MSQKRKLQVFVSSTFTDLKEERQAAVEAILKAGHIPAGMELFSAGDQSQMTVIKKWIDESDVYLLLLGGRYGSIEPITGKSYTHLEYEYALEKGKAIFSVVMSDSRLDEKNRILGKEVLELHNPQKYHEFKAFVKTKLVEEWSDVRDIKLAILSTLSDFSQRPELVGWVPGNEVTNSGEIAEQIARLVKENESLRIKVNKADKQAAFFNGLEFNEVLRLLETEVLDEPKFKDGYIYTMHSFPHITASHHYPTLLQFFWLWNVYDRKAKISPPFEVERDSYGTQLLNQLVEVGLVEEEVTKTEWGGGFIDSAMNDYYITSSGFQFALRLKLMYDYNMLVEAVEQLRLQLENKRFDPFEF